MIKKNSGFNIIELMVAIATSATLVATIITSFSKLYNLFLYNTKYLAVNQELRIAMQIMKNDLNNAGVFGSYSFHNQDPSSFDTISIVKSNSCATSAKDVEKCSFDTDSVGVKSFPKGSTTALDVSTGYTLTSDVLRIQFGNDKPSNMKAFDENGDGIVSKCGQGVGQYFLNQLPFPAQNTDLDTSYPFLMLSSANHAYLLQSKKGDQIVSGTASSGFILDTMKNNSSFGSCPNGGIQGISAIPVTIRLDDKVNGVESSPFSLKYDVTEPDIHSLSLVNLYTSYYFTATVKGKESGLYVVRQGSDLKLTTPELVSSAVKSISFEFMLDSADTFNHTGNNKLGRFTICSTDQMEPTGDIRCSERWTKIVAVNITVTGQGYSSQMSADQFDQTFTDTVGWLQ